jgi:hypothetical protein
MSDKSKRRRPPSARPGGEREPAQKVIRTFVRVLEAIDTAARRPPKPRETGR